MKNSISAFASARKTSNGSAQNPSVRRKTSNGSSRSRSKRSSAFEDSDDLYDPNIDPVIDNQNLDGSWDTFYQTNYKLEEQFGKKAAATVAAIVYLTKNAKERLGSFKLIIMKAYQFLHSIKDIDWETIVKDELKL